MSPSMMSNWSTSAVPISSYAASSTATSYTPTYSWAHTVPAYMPWTTTVPTPVMQFTAPFPPDPCTSQTATGWELLHNLGASQARSSNHQHLKRKNDSLENLSGDRIEASCQSVQPLDTLRCFQSPKQYISEEKMLARLNELHISNNTIPSKDTKATAVSVDTENKEQVKSLEEQEIMFADESEEESDIENGGITLSPELKKLVKSDSFLQESFLKDRKEPSMALVLWQPPVGVLPEKLKVSFSSVEQKRNDLKTESYSEYNNNDTTIDRNCTSVSRNDHSLLAPEEKIHLHTDLFEENEDNDMDL